MMNITTTSQTHRTLLPLQLLATRYGYAALLDADNNELPITESMIHSACEDAMDALYSYLPQRTPHLQQST